ncbi:MAG: hypothetical protein IKZ34_00775 [Alphaproteobacteria bacterium]|nr:hypothetical protein [Alphaproteobacteria bacterium]
MDTIFIIFTIIAIIISIILLNGLYCTTTVPQETITVSDKGIVVKSHGENNSTISDYMIYTTNGQAIKNTNNIWFWKWNSDEIQGKLKKAKNTKSKHGVFAFLY